MLDAGTYILFPYSSRMGELKKTQRKQNTTGATLIPVRSVLLISPTARVTMAGRALVQQTHTEFKWGKKQDKAVEML